MSLRQPNFGENFIIRMNFMQIQTRESRKHTDYLEITISTKSFPSRALSSQKIIYLSGAFSNE